MNPLKVLSVVACWIYLLLDTQTFAFVLLPSPSAAQHTNTVLRLKATTAKAETDEHPEFSASRRELVGPAIAASLTSFLVAATAKPQASWAARYMLDEETGDYVEVEDADWQTVWKQRLDKASGMSKDEIFQAARGAGNTDLKSGPESDASKKRRAMSACRDPAVRAKAGMSDEKACTARVFGGDVELLLDAL